MMISWTIRIGNVLANTGQWFAIPYAGTALAQVPSLEVAGFSAMIGIILSATREWFDYVREKQRAKKDNS